jgi:orotate phosphoribosyltransferase
VAAPDVSTTDRDELADLVRRLAVVHGRVTLSSGKEADYYVDLRRATLHHRAGPLIGRLIRELTDDWEYRAALSMRSSCGSQ